MFEGKVRSAQPWSRTSPRVYWKNISRNKHVLQVYENEAALIVSLNCFARSGFSAGEPVIIVATGTHLRELTKSLHLFGVDTDSLRLEKQLVFIEAEDMLSEIMIGDMPDEDKFVAALSRVLDVAGITAWTPARIFGEMVSLLWSQGKREATVALEDMWNRACARLQLTLFCAYPREIFGHEDQDQFIHICAHHAGILGHEGASYTEVKFKSL